MNLLFYIGSMRSGGAERVMSILINELKERGHQITLATLSNEPSFYKIDERINHIYFGQKMTGSFLQRMKYRLNLYSFLRKTTKSTNPDVVISFMHGLNASVILSHLFLKTPVIASERTTFKINLPRNVQFKRYYINKLATKVTLLTQADYDYIGNKLSNKIVMPNPLSYAPITNYNSNREKNIIAVGGLHRYHIKGFDNLIKVWGKVSINHPEWKLLIAGKSDQQSEKILNKIAIQYNVQNQIQFLGEIKNIDELFKNNSIFVLSSRYEGFGNVITEAMSQGCTCISFDCDTGPREIITNGVDGILVENQNLDEMKSLLSDLIKDKFKRDKLSINAIESVKRFSVKNIIDKWESLFDEIITK